MKLVAIMAMAVASTPVAAETITFSSRTDSLPAAHVYGGGWDHFVGGGVAVFDCDEDLRPEIFAAGGENPARLFLNRSEPGDWAFTQGELPDIDGTVGAYPLDVGGDGVIDLFVLTTHQNRLLRGLGDCRFEDVTDDYALPTDDRWSTAFSATWEPGASLPTLAIGNYVDRKDPDGPFQACDSNQIVRPNGWTYLPDTALAPGYCPLSILFSDWARQGHADLRISNDRHYYVRGGSEQMWTLRDNRFLDETDGWVDMSIWGMGIASRDITGDMRPDVVLTSMGDQLLQLSTATGFAAAPYATGTYAHRPFTGDDGRPSTGWHAEFGDVNNDGLPDLFIAKGNVDQMPGSAMKDPNNLLIQQTDGTFVEMAERAGVASTVRSRGAALADFDRDGRLDLVVNNRRAPLEIYRNETAAAGNWLSILLRQSDPNTFSVGAWIEIRDADGRVQTQEITVGGGHAGGSLGFVHFGLGASDGADLRVIWPDGEASDWTTLQANQPVRVWRQNNGGLAVTRLNSP